MKIPKELAQQLADLHNTMATISTAGDNTVKMAACLVGMRNILSQSEIVSADAEEQDDGQ